MARYRAIGFAVLIACVASVRGGARAAAPDDPGDVMRRIASAVSAADRDVIGYRSEGRLRIAGGLYRHEQTEMRWYVLVAGKLVATGLRQGSGPSFGKDSDRQSHEPWGAYEPEYAFARTACTGCAEGVDAIAFTSAFHDADHGYGVLTVDAARAVVLHERLVPYAFNGPTTTGTIDTDFGETELGWRPRAVHGDFAGRVGPFSGTAHLEDVLHDYRRFPTVEGAIAALSP